jgi:RimJ/RimL family protein N-acetyltransferase
MSSSGELVRLWPASGVRVRSGELELRWIDDDLMLELAALAARGVHAADAMPFEHPWTRGTPDDVARSVMTYQWNARTRVSPATFVLELGVIDAGVPVGVQGLVADDWSVLRRVQTGSWLGLDHQGRGVGRRMRLMALHLAFAGLGAREATTGAFADNPASNAVTRRLGYEPNGSVLVARDGEPALHHNYRMSHEQWQLRSVEHAAFLGAPVEMDGVDALRAFLTPDVP